MARYRMKLSAEDFLKGWIKMNITKADHTGGHQRDGSAASLAITGSMAWHESFWLQTFNLISH